MDLNLLKTLVETNSEDDPVHYEAVSNVLGLLAGLQNDGETDTYVIDVYACIKEAYSVDWDWSEE